MSYRMHYLVATLVVAWPQFDRLVVGVLVDSTVHTRCMSVITTERTKLLVPYLFTSIASLLTIA